MLEDPTFNASNVNVTDSDECAFPSPAYTLITPDAEEGAVPPEHPL